MEGQSEQVFNEAQVPETVDGGMVLPGELGALESWAQDGGREGKVESEVATGSLGAKVRPQQSTLQNGWLDGVSGLPGVSALPQPMAAPGMFAPLPLCPLRCGIDLETLSCIFRQTRGAAASIAWGLQGNMQMQEVTVPSQREGGCASWEGLYICSV